MTVVVTAGHVDHGKSSLVRALTGTDPDRLEEEQRRGLTIQLGFAHMTLPSGAPLSFVDVPGHVRFLRNMLSGVGGVSGCVFVVAATEGWKPQSEEHLRILEFLGVERGIVALTKVDVADADVVEIARLDVEARVAGTFLADGPLVEVGTPVGIGLDDLRTALDDLVGSAPEVADSGRPRLWIDRVFAAKGSGTVVTGTLAGGSLAIEGDVTIEPGGVRARIRGLQTAGRALDRVAPGTRVAVNLARVDHGDLRRGMAVVEPDTWHRTDRFDASLHVLERLTHDVTRRGAYAVHLGSGEHHAALRVLGDEALAPGAAGFVRVHLPEAIPLVPGDRYVLREFGRDETIGGGEVLDVAPVLPASRARPDRSVDRVVRERRWIAAAELERLTGVRQAPLVGEWVTTPDLLDEMSAALVERVRAAGPSGLDLATFDERERSVLPTLTDVVIDAGRARPVGETDPFADHPFLAALRDGGLAPPSPDGIARGELRELVRRGHAVVRNGVYFHPSAIDAAAVLAASLLATDPDGFTVAAFRDAAGTTRKFVLPLVAELDARGITRRRGDLRVAGPRLPV